MGVRITEKQFKDFLNGDETVLRRIMFDESKIILTNIRRLVKTDFDAEEILQDVFMEIWSERSKFANRMDLYNYMYASARFKALKFLRKRMPDTVDIQNYIHQACDDMAPDAQSLFEANELALKISMTVNSMPQQRQKVFKMCRLDGMTRSEIAEKLELSPQTVSQHLHKAMGDLRKILISLIILLVNWYK